jgi:G3E family GTPase
VPKTIPFTALRSKSTLTTEGGILQWSGLGVYWLLGDAENSKRAAATRLVELASEKFLPHEIQIETALAYTDPTWACMDHRETFQLATRLRRAEREGIRLLVVLASPFCVPRELAAIAIEEEVVSVGFGTCIDPESFRDAQSSRTDERPALEPITDCLVDSIEYTEWISLDPGGAREELKYLTRVLQTRAPIVDSELLLTPKTGQEFFRGISSPKILDPDDLIQGASWSLALQMERDHPGDEAFLVQPLTRVWIYRRRRSFHPKRFQSVLDHWPHQILRTVGTLWMASYPEDVFGLSQFGPADLQVSHDGEWLRFWPKEDQEAILAENPEFARLWDSELGDQMNELVFVTHQHPTLSDDGLATAQAVWFQKLDEALLTDIELRMPPDKMRSPSEPNIFDECVSEAEQPTPPTSTPQGRSRGRAHLRILGPVEPPPL